MSSLTFLSLCGASVILLLLTTASHCHDDELTTPVYDDNTSFSISFFSNTSFEELEKLSERFFDPDEEDEEDEEEEEEDEDWSYGGGWKEEQEVTATTATTRRPTEGGGVNSHNTASLPFSMELSTLVWTLMIVISVNLQQLQHTL